MLAVIHGHSLPPGMTIEAESAVAFPRHGLKHQVPAHRVDHHANVTRLKEMGVDQVVALASVGSLRTDWPAGTLVTPDDFFALGIAPTFYDDTRGHSVPGFDLEWRQRLITIWAAHAELAIEPGNCVYAHVPGPRFETPAEVRMLGQFADVVGMTIAAEAILAREAGISYAALCTVDNLANGLEEEPLSVEEYRDFRAEFAPKLAADLAKVLPALA